MITLHRLGVYRDHAEALIQVELREAELLSSSAELHMVKLGDLTPRERSSLRVLSADCRLLHVSWDSYDAVRETSSSADAAHDSHAEDQGHSSVQSELLRDHDSPLSSPLSQRHTRAQERLEALRALKTQRESASPPTTLAELRRSLEIEEQLSELELAWAVQAQGSSLHQPHTERSRAQRDHERLKSSTLCLYVESAAERQRDSSAESARSLSAERSPSASRADASLPDALSGGWLDSSPPATTPTVIRQAESMSARVDHHVNSRAIEEGSGSGEGASVTPSVWLSLRLTRSSWRPHVTLFINGERGRITLTARLVTEGLSAIFSDLDDPNNIMCIPPEGVEVEWWEEGEIVRSLIPVDDDRSRRQAQRWRTHESAPLTSRLSGSDLFKRSHSYTAPMEHNATTDAARLHLTSSLLVERSLSALGREHLLLTQRGPSSDTRDDESRSSEQRRELGYFALSELFKYPPTLVNGVEQALRGQHVCRLSLPRAEVLLDATPQWEVQLNGERRFITPRRERGGLVSLGLGLSRGLEVKRIDGGLELVSSLSQSRQVAVYDISRRALLLERRLPPLGRLKLSSLGERLKEVSARPQREVTEEEGGAPEAKTQELEGPAEGAKRAVSDEPAESEPLRGAQRGQERGQSTEESAEESAEESDLATNQDQLQPAQGVQR